MNNKKILLFLLIFNTFYSYGKNRGKLKNTLLGEVCITSLNYEFYDSVPSGFTVDNIPTTGGALSTGIATNFNVNSLQNTVDPGDTDRYAVRYTGVINVSVAGVYTFYTRSDDGSKLLINGTEVVDNDGLHGSRERNGNITLAAGTHTITVLFFENTGGDFLEVNYGINGTKLSFPFCSSFLDSDGDTIYNFNDLDDDNDGILDTDEEGCYGIMNYEFYDLRPSGNTVDAIPTTGALATGTVSDFNVNSLQNLVDAGDTNNFSIRYTGNITIPTTGLYTFYTSSDDGSKLLIDGFEIVNNDGLHGNTERNGVAQLKVGLHQIEVLFFEAGGAANLTVQYQGPSITKTPIPFTSLSCGLDTDNDSLPNYLDTDSDADGCPDALEGAGSFSVNDLVNYGTDNSFGDVIDGDGIPTVNGVSAQQGNTLAVIDNLIANCFVDLSLTKTVNNAIPKVGSFVIYTIKITNSGPGNATNIIVKDKLPTNLTYRLGLSTIPENTTYNSTTGDWNLANFTLINGNSISLQIAALVNNVGVITNTAEIIHLDQIDTDSNPDSKN